MRRTCIVAWTLCSAVLQAAETPLYHAEFSSPLSGDWQVLDGRAAVENGRLTVRSDRSNPLVRLNRTFDGDLSIRLRLLRGPNSHWSGVVVKDTWWLTLQNEFAAVLLVRRRPDKPRETKELAWIGNWAAFVEDPHDFELRLDCQGSKLRAYLDGLLVAKVEDPGMPKMGGLALVGGWDTDVGFDDLTVRRFDATTLPKPPIVSPVSPPAGLRADLDRPDAVYREDETVRISVGWRAADTGEVALALRLIDVDGQVIVEEQRRVQQRSGQQAGFRLTYSKLPRGVFKLALDRIMASGSTVHQRDVPSFAILPRQPEEQSASDDSPFGAHPHWEVPQFHYPLARKLGMRWARSHDAIQYTWWIHSQPTPNQWRWFDDELAILQQNGLSLLGAFMTVPGWASGGPNTGYGSRRPPDLQLFGRYVYEVVRHYKDRIHVWEIWNEPHFRGFWEGTPEEYAAMAAVAYREAKRADPQCQVIGGGGISLDPNSLRWTERAFAAGLLQHCDALSFHYGYQGSAVSGPRKRFLGDLASLRSMMRAHGGEKPLWNTEAAVPTTSFLDQYRAPRSEPEAPYHFRRAADAVVQMLTVNLAGGVKKIFYYDLVWPRRDAWVAKLTAEPVQTAMLEGHGGPKPLAVAYTTAATLLDQAQFIAALEPAPNVPVYVFRHGEQSIAVLWAEVGRDGGPFRLRVEHEGTWELTDVMNRRTDCGGELRIGHSPLFVIARSDPDAFQRAWRQAKASPKLGPKDSHARAATP